jgi:hypothetical protein
MEKLDVTERKNPQATAFRQSINYNVRKKLHFPTPKEELVSRFGRCWEEYKKALTQYTCYDESWLFSQLFNHLARFCVNEEKDEFLSLLKNKYNMRDVIIRPSRTRKTQPKPVSAPRRVYTARRLKKGEKQIQTLRETKEISGLKFCNFASTYGIVLSNKNVLNSLSIRLQ